MFAASEPNPDGKNPVTNIHQQKHGAQRIANDTCTFNKVLVTHLRQNIALDVIDVLPLI
jgi:hypothetical protein